MRVIHKALKDPSRLGREVIGRAGAVRLENPGKLAGRSPTSDGDGRQFAAINAPKRWRPPENEPQLTGNGELEVDQRTIGPLFVVPELLSTTQRPRSY
jgi:hypothetical protein